MIDSVGVSCVETKQPYFVFPIFPTTTTTAAATDQLHPNFQKNCSIFLPFTFCIFYICCHQLVLRNVAIYIVLLFALLHKLGNLRPHLPLCTLDFEREKDSHFQIKPNELTIERNSHLTSEASSGLPEEWNGLAADVARGSKEVPTSLHLPPDQVLKMPPDQVWEKSFQILRLLSFLPPLSPWGRTGPCCSGVSRQRREVSHRLCMILNFKKFSQDYFKCSPYAQVDRIFHPLFQ